MYANNHVLGIAAPDDILHAEAAADPCVRNPRRSVLQLFVEVSDLVPASQALRQPDAKLPAQHLLVDRTTLTFNLDLARRVAGERRDPRALPHSVDNGFVVEDNTAIITAR